MLEGLALAYFSALALWELATNDEQPTKITALRLPRERPRPRVLDGRHGRHENARQA